MHARTRTRARETDRQKMPCRCDRIRTPIP